MFAAGVVAILAIAGALVVGYAIYAIVRAAVRDGIIEAGRRTRD